MRKVILPILFFLSCILTFAQTNTLYGVVRDQAGEPLSYASVVLSRDTLIVAGGVTDAKGRFQIKAEPGAYTLTAEFIGYTKFSRMLELSSPRTDAGVITLEESARTLSEAGISARREAVKSSVERTTINADANISGARSSVLDILRGASSVVVTSERGVTVRGKSNVLILLDGIPTTVTDLESIPAANVRSVEVITNPDARYDSEGTGGIINIVSRKQTAQGLSGIIGVNYGFNHFANGNFAIAGNRPELSWRVSGSAKYEDDWIDGSLLRTFVSSGNGIEQKIGSAKTTFNGNLAVGATFRPDRKNVVAVDVKFLLPRYNTKQNFHNTYTTGGVRSEENRYSDITWNRENLDVSASWKRVMKPEFSDFSLAANVSKIWGHRPSYYYLEK